VGRDDAGIEHHPLPKLFRHGIPVVLSTDDPALFETTLRGEYALATRMGLQENELEQICSMGFQYAFSGDTGTHPPNTVVSI
jgi:adenosine deaminase